jgi:hypothetical protein
MKTGSLFSGYSGLDLAVDAFFGSETVWVSDIDPCKILAHHWPHLPNLGDITRIDWSAMKLGANRKLTDEQVASAVRMYRDLEMSLQQVAEYFEVSRQAMWDLLRRRIPLRPQQRTGSDNHFWRGGPRADNRAHDITENAIEKGLLVRPDRCQECGGDGRAFRDGRHPIQAHHCDYNKPLEVMWLCQPCHHDWHRTNTAVAVEGGDARGSLADIDVLTGGFP